MNNARRSSTPTRSILAGAALLLVVGLVWLVTGEDDVVRSDGEAVGAGDAATSATELARSKDASADARAVVADDAMEAELTADAPHPDDSSANAADAVANANPDVAYLTRVMEVREWVSFGVVPDVAFVGLKRTGGEVAIDGHFDGMRYTLPCPLDLWCIDVRAPRHIDARVGVFADEVDAVQEVWLERAGRLTVQWSGLDAALEYELRFPQLGEAPGAQRIAGATGEHVFDELSAYVASVELFDVTKRQPLDRAEFLFENGSATARLSAQPVVDERPARVDLRVSGLDALPMVMVTGADLRVNQPIELVLGDDGFARGSAEVRAGVHHVTMLPPGRTIALVMLAPGEVRELEFAMPALVDVSVECVDAQTGEPFVPDSVSWHGHVDGVEAWGGTPDDVPLEARFTVRLEPGTYEFSADGPRVERGAERLDAHLPRQILAGGETLTLRFGASRSEPARSQRNITLTPPAPLKEFKPWKSLVVFDESGARVDHVSIGIGERVLVGTPSDPSDERELLRMLHFDAVTLSFTSHATRFRIVPVVDRDQGAFEVVEVEVDEEGRASAALVPKKRE